MGAANDQHGLFVCGINVLIRSSESAAKLILPYGSPFVIICQYCDHDSLSNLNTYIIGPIYTAKRVTNWNIIDDSCVHSRLSLTYNSERAHRNLNQLTDLSGQHRYTGSLL